MLQAITKMQKLKKTKIKIIICLKEVIVRVNSLINNQNHTMILLEDSLTQKKLKTITINPCTELITLNLNFPQETKVHKLYRFRILDYHYIQVRASKD